MRDVSDDYALLAVQGPRALERLGIAKGKAFTWEMGTLDGVEVMINRTGYTGEEGVELACMDDERRLSGTRSWRAVSRRAGSARATRCGSRSVTRCTATTSARSGTRSRAGSAGSARSTRSSRASSALREIKAAGPEQRLVAFRMTEQAIPRQGMAIEGGGEVTSGSLSPMLEVGIGLGYVPASASAPGTELTIDVRGKPRRAVVVPKPIYKREE